MTAALIDQAWRRGLAAPPMITVSAWADKHRVLPVVNAEPGPWRTARVPYLREIMDCLSAGSPVERVVVMKAAQVGATEAALNAVAYWIDAEPGTILAAWPSIDMLRRNSRTRIDPLFDGTPALRAKVARARSRTPGNTVALKEFPGGSLVLTGANSAVGLRSTPARYLVLDEIDAFPQDVGEEGDPVALAIARTVTYRGRRKIMLISTPTVRGLSRIERAYEESDRRKYFVPCPHCGAYQVLRWAGVTWPGGRPQAAFYKCEHCGGSIGESDKPAMLARGEWRATAPGDGRTAGFHVSGLMSPFETWPEIAVDFAASHRDPVRLKTWTNLRLGETWEDRDAEPLEAEAFLARLESFGDQLPEGIAVITCGVDVQGDRLEWEIAGWGSGEESWSISYDRLWCDPARAESWAALDAELLRTFDHPKSGPMPVAAVCIDSGGHHTQQVYRFARERFNRRIWAVKGRGGPGVPVWPQRPPRIKVARQSYAPFIVGVDAAKEAVMSRLRLAEPGPGYCHFPAGRDLEYFRQLTAEKLIRSYRRGVLIREWKKDPGVHNEALDCRVYAFAALQGLTALGLRLNAPARADAPVRPGAAASVPMPPAPRPTVIRSRWFERGGRWH
jgi:phage terminase large subunit GpA-like protein